MNSATREELAWWRQWFATKGNGFHRGYCQRLDPRLPLQQRVNAVLPPRSDPVRILDVGAGPVCALGKCCMWSDRAIQIVAVDVLGDEYASLRREFGIAPTVEVVTVAAEELTSHFELSSFDVVHARNSLDHMCKPLTALDQMFAVLKPGGHLVLHHFINEGERQRYRGLHQWNLCVEQGRPLLWLPNEKHDLNSVFGKTVQQFCYEAEEDWLTMWFRKTSLETVLDGRESSHAHCHRAAVL